jgi:hypothetical protein
MKSENSYCVETLKNISKYLEIFYLFKSDLLFLR